MRGREGGVTASADPPTPAHTHDTPLPSSPLLPPPTRTQRTVQRPRDGARGAERGGQGGQRVLAQHGAAREGVDVRGERLGLPEEVGLGGVHQFWLDGFNLSVVCVWVGGWNGGMGDG